jgi:hypothetical protein
LRSGQGGLSLRRGPAIFLLICLLTAAAYGAGRVASEGLGKVADFTPTNLQATLPVAGPPPLAQRLVLVLVDGLRTEDAPFLPTLDWLAQRGASLRLTVPAPGFELPGTATLLTGARPQTHGALLPPAIRTLNADNLLTAARRVRITTGGAGSPALGAFLRPSLDSWQNASSPAQLQQQLAALLAPGGPRLVVLHTDDLYKESRKLRTADRSDSGYLDRLADLDAQLVNMLQGIDWKSTAVVVAGLMPTDRYAIYDPGAPVPLIMAGPGIKPGYRGTGSLVDVASTLATIAGTPIPLANEGLPLLGALEVTGRPADVVLQRVMESRKAFTDAALLSMGSSATAPEVPSAAEQVGPYVAGLEQALRSARFAAWKESLIAIAPYAAGVLLVALIYLIAVWRSQAGSAIFLGNLTYGAAFHAIFFLTGGRYSASLAGLDSPGRWLAWRLAGVSVAAMLLSVLVAGHFLARRGFRKRGFIGMAACHLALSTAFLVAVPTAVLVTFTGWEFRAALPAPGFLVWFFVAALQVIAIGCLSPVWALLTVSAASISRRLWPLKEVGDPERNADKVVRLRAMRRTTRRRTVKR